MNTCLLAVLCLATAALAYACSPKPVDAPDSRIPANVLSEKEFAKVLTDFALAESAANLNVKNVPNQRLDTVYAFDPLKDNHLSKARYDSTVLFYAAHTDLYKKVYENVLTNLSNLQTQRDSISPPKDSLSR